MLAINAPFGLKNLVGVANRILFIQFHISGTIKFIKVRCSPGASYLLRLSKLPSLELICADFVTLLQKNGLSMRLSNLLDLFSGALNRLNIIIHFIPGNGIRGYFC